jgi:hypothetical protein
MRLVPGGETCGSWARERARTVLHQLLHGDRITRSPNAFARCGALERRQCSALGAITASACPDAELESAIALHRSAICRCGR